MIHELRLPLAPYRFEWRAEPATGASKRSTDRFSEEQYTHADGTFVTIRQYHADGSLLVRSDRAEIELIDNARDPYAPEPISVVKLP